MKTFKISLLCLLLCIMSAMSFAQTPEKMSYQAVFRNMYDRLITEQPVAVQISILQGGADGTVVFQEKQTVTPNADGIGTFEIGGGTAVVGTLKDINWAEGPYYLKAEMDPEGGEEFTVDGTVELAAVPYAFYANASAGEFSGKYEDLTGTPEIPVVPTNISELENNSGFMAKEAQQLEMVGNTLTLTGATNIVELPAFTVFESDPTKNVVNRPEGVKAGELMYWDADAATWKTVAPGVAGYVLRMGEDGVPVWQRRPGTKTAPQVTISAGEEYAYTGAIKDDGGLEVTARGFKYATTAGVANNASAGDVAIADGDDFTAVIPATGHNKTYYVVAYATNEKGTSYSDELSFVTPDFPRCGTLVDIDGNEYKTVIIGKQCWMAEDLRVETMPDGTPMVAKKPVSAVGNYWKGQTIQGEDIVLYPWRTAANKNGANTSEAFLRGICPEGWHLPSYTEWRTLFMTIDPDCNPTTSTANAETEITSTNKLGIKMASPEGHWVYYKDKEGTGHAIYSCPTPAEPAADAEYKDLPNTPGYTYPNFDDPDFNASGFSALPHGYIYRTSPYDYFHNGAAFYWTSYSANVQNSLFIRVNFDTVGPKRVKWSQNGNDYYSVRCMSDKTFGD